MELVQLTPLLMNLDMCKLPKQLKFIIHELEHETVFPLYLDQCCPLSKVAENNDFFFMSSMPNNQEQFLCPQLRRVAEAYWFGPVGPSVSLCVTLALGSLEIWSWNLVCGISMKIKKTRICFLVHRICHCRVIALFKVFFIFITACEQNISRTASARVMKFIS